MEIPEILGRWQLWFDHGEKGTTLTRVGLIDEDKMSFFVGIGCMLLSISNEDV